MMKNVSIITPCYNGEQFVGRYLESVLNQSYKNIEMILVNDGSTDRTEEIVLGYKRLFEEQGMTFIYIYQENAGQAAALNKGLAIFTGDYLTWPDSDDILMSDSIEKKVAFLEQNPDYGFVRTDAIYVNEDNTEKVQGYFARNKNNKYSQDIFYDLIVEEMYVCCGCYMVKTESFLNINPQRRIFVGNGGQNWQMLLPMAYNYKCGYIDEALYTYVIRENSHSHSLITKEKQLTRCDDHEEILLNTLNKIQIPSEELLKYNSLIEQKYLRKKLQIAGLYRDNIIAKEQYLKLSNKYQVKKIDKLYYFMSFNIISFYVVKVLFKFKNLWIKSLKIRRHIL